MEINLRLIYGNIRDWNKQTIFSIPHKRVNKT